jgi:hypothetical protein
LLVFFEKTTRKEKKPLKIAENIQEHCKQLYALLGEIPLKNFTLNELREIIKIKISAMNGRYQNLNEKILTSLEKKAGPVLAAKNAKKEIKKIVETIEKNFRPFPQINPEKTYYIESTRQIKYILNNAGLPAENYCKNKLCPDGKKRDLIKISGHLLELILIMKSRGDISGDFEIFIDNDDGEIKKVKTNKS